MLHRRIDIKTYPCELYPLALLYFTGPEYFNRTTRFLAERLWVTDWLSVCVGARAPMCDCFPCVCPPLHCFRGFHLSDKEFVDRGRSPNVPIVCKSEADVFTALGLPYMEPNERGLVDIPLPSVVKRSGAGAAHPKVPLASSDSDE